MSPSVSSATSPAAPDWALELLRTARVGRLGTADAAGRPLVLPVCYAYDGAACYSPIDTKPKRGGTLRRVRNIRENARVSLAVDRWAEDWRELAWVVVEGEARMLAAGAELDGAAGLLLAKYPQYAALGLSREDDSMIRIAAERVIHWRWA